MKQSVENSILYGCLAISVIALLFTAYTVTSSIFIKPKIENQQQSTNVNKMALRFTEFDRNKAIEFMDSNGDGMCDFCGMRIEDCMASGMMQCTMDPDSKIGLLKSDHYHIDLKVYQNGKQINLADPKYFVKSSFVHVENDGPEKTGNVLHIHAIGIDLKFFLDSLGVKINNAKVYVNGQLNNEGLNHVPKNSDRILITDLTSQEEVQQQLKTVTSFISKA